MRPFVLALGALVISAGDVFASPLPSSDSMDALNARSRLSSRAQRGGNAQAGGNAQTGNSGNVNGGSVTNTASRAGSISNVNSCMYLSHYTLASFIDSSASICR